MFSINLDLLSVSASGGGKFLISVNDTEAQQMMNTVLKLTMDMLDSYELGY